ncbi:MAG TPA: coenzyme F420-0:L-glutamate ligase [Methanosarcinaceae archaeon]|nr:coenzyme F420-0:L-glutamate ligase [Methanosarcinaceae archaeon]
MDDTSYSCSSMQMFGIRTVLIKPNDDIVEILLNSFESLGIHPVDGDILVLAESAVATAENRVVQLRDVTPSEKAEKIAQKYELDAREMELILQECDEIFGGVPGAALTITNGTLSPNAGIDGSNAPDGCVVLLPKDAQKSAALIRAGIEKRYSCRVGVIIGDSRTQPLRLGCVGIALGTSGIRPVEDARGSCDLFGKTLHITQKAVADNLVSASQVLMGEADEGVPCVLVRGAPVEVVEGAFEMPLFSSDECMYYSNIKRK